MNTVWRIAREEWRLMRRDRVAVVGLALLLLLSATAALTGWQQRQATAADRARHQARANAEFDAQPDRHPHRMVHYGHFVFRPLNPLAAFDPGIDPYTGHTLYLEGHRQNSANFGDVRQSSLLLRFGQLTPAFVLQVLAPLLLVFVGHAAVARERASGTLRVLLAQGVRPGALVGGKVLALGGVAAVLLLPSLLALAAAVLADGASPWRAVLLGAGHGVWLMGWAVGIAAVSTLCARRRDALLVLLAAWAIAVVLVPRLAASHAAAGLVLPTRFETDIAVQRDLAALGDAHDPDDPYFADFRRQVLARHGVTRVEDLPVNYKGVLGVEGERLTTALFARYADASFDQQHAQSRWMDRFALLSPALAVRRLSLAAAGTDLASHRHFLEQAEAHRYRLVQALNTLQAERLGYADDRNPLKQNRVDRTLWRGQGDFHPQPLPEATAWADVRTSGASLLVWALAATAALAWATRRLGRAAR